MGSAHALQEIKKMDRIPRASLGRKDVAGLVVIGANSLP